MARRRHSSLQALQMRPVLRQLLCFELPALTRPPVVAFLPTLAAMTQRTPWSPLQTPHPRFGLRSGVGGRIG